MRKFLTNVAAFTLFIAATSAVVLFLPVTPRASKSFCYSIIQKDSLLATVDSPRMIFIGGSNISFGLNSRMIKDSLNVNPINTGITSALGLKFMFENTAQYIKPGDVVIASLEYEHFTNNDYSNGETLLRMVMDVNKKYVRLLNFRQTVKSFLFMPGYIASKLNPSAYFSVEVSPQYNRNSFNEYGDECAHWNMKNSVFSKNKKLNPFNRRIIDRIKDFERTVEQKGATFYITYPSCMAASFDESKDVIALIQTELEKNVKTLGVPERYRMPDSLMFDTSYHLNKTGVDLRTARLIEDVRSISR